MVLVISQETFDDVVKENIQEFNMSPEEAVKEAIEQFRAQVIFVFQPSARAVFHIFLTVSKTENLKKN